MNDLRELLQHPAIASDVSAEDYVSMDNLESTGESLTDQDIVDLVDPTVDEDDEYNFHLEDDDDDDTAAPSDVTVKGAREHLKSMISYFEQGSSLDNDSILQRNRTFISQLLAMQNAMTEDSCKYAPQKKMTDYFKV